MNVFVTGGSGYVGRRLITALVARRHRIRALVRDGSQSRIPSGAETVLGNALDAISIANALNADETLVHLVGTPHPNPSKAREFEAIDLTSIRASVEAAQVKQIPHLIYVSVAHPAPTMHAYVAARVAGEAAIGSAQLTATVLRPWYVVGPGHWWPVVLMPVYAVMEALPGTRDTARRLGLVTLQQMVSALVVAVESRPPEGTQRIVDVPAIRVAKPGSA
jgi:uncharacterized protein YbjT (DUF2867 family)